MFSVQSLLIGALFFLGENARTEAGLQFVDEIVLKRQGLPDVLLDPLVINDWTPKEKTDVLVHSYGETSSSPWVSETSALCLSEDHNVILVSYQTIAAKEYKVAVSESSLVGMEVSTVLANLFYNNALDPSTVEVIGLSLGGQIATFVGEYFQEITSQSLDTRTIANYQFVDDVVLKRQGVADVSLDPLIINDWTIKEETNIIVHSYLGNPTDAWVVQTADHFLALDHNVILVDYQTIAGKIYELAANESDLVGIEVGTILANLVNNNGLDPLTIDIVGFSLGAQVAGFIGQYFQEMTSQQINTITGLDPAGVDFQGQSRSQQLDSRDAVFVQVIHTDYSIGNKNKKSDVDFVINRPKRDQPGCSDNVCSHWRAVDLYLESLGDACPTYTARMCGTQDYFQAGLGYRVDPSLQGRVCISAPGESSPLCN